MKILFTGSDLHVYPFFLDCSTLKAIFEGFSDWHIFGYSFFTTQGNWKTRSSNKKKLRLVYFAV